MKVTLSFLVLGTVLAICFADPCYDGKAMAEHKEKIKEECKTELMAAPDAKSKVIAAVMCCLTKHGAIDGNNVLFDKLRELATADALEGKASIITAGYDACKEHFTTVDKLLEGKKCVYEQIKDQCSDVKTMGEMMKQLLE